MPAGGSGRARQVPVDVIRLEPGLLTDETFTTGSLQANERVELRNELAGRVMSISFDEGSLVKKGALLLKINDQELQAQLEKASSQKVLAEREEYRKARLLEIKAISQEEYDLAWQQLQSISSEISLLKAQIEKTEIRAPFDGRIGLRQVSPGGYLSANSPIAVIQQLDPVKIEFNIPEKYALSLVNGMKVKFSLENSQEVFEAEVYAVESSIDPSTRSMRARALCRNSNGKLIPGSFARVNIVLAQIPDAITIPSESLITEMEGNRVYLLKDGKASSVKVSTGLRTSSEIQITSGLSAGDSLIITGLMQISDGTPVSVKGSAGSKAPGL